MVLSDSDFVVYEYEKYLRGKKYPLLVLTYIGVRNGDIPCQEIVWGLSGVEKVIQNKKKRVVMSTLSRSKTSHGV
jgi:hypothetical protein